MPPDEGKKRSAKGAASVPKIASDYGAKESHERFRALLGGLLGVPKNDVYRKIARKKAARKRKRS